MQTVKPSVVKHSFFFIAFIINVLYAIMHALCITKTMKVLRDTIDLVFNHNLTPKNL